MQTHSRRSMLKWMAAGAGTALLTGVYGESSADWLEVQRQTLRLPRWDADGFKVALLSDTHTNDDHELARAQRAVELALAEKPDLIVFAGDFQNSAWPDVNKRVRKAFERLHDARCPCVAVLGNHDYSTHDTGKLIRNLSRTPFKLLRNELFEVDGVVVAGVDDAIARPLEPEFVANLKAKSVLGLLHEPDFVDEMPANYASLQLSGHSHGGQLCLPFGIPLRTPRGARRYIAGYFAETPTPLFVSKGIGTTGPTWRTFCRPEINILTLRGA